MQAEADRRFMRLAIALGERGLGRVWPNPAVGCVIVKDGVIVGRGWTQPGGRPHAEVVALQEAGSKARGAVAYVSLEPCAHHGRTGPCAEALLSAGVARVVTALTDPDPRVAGRGHAILRGAGVAVTEGVEAERARVAQQGFLSRVERGRPMVTLKLALSLDARIATAAGQSRWITGAEARRAVHLMRARHDAVMVGVGTALADDPDLRVRDLGIGWQPVRVVVDTRLRLSPDCRLGRSAGSDPVWILHGPDVSEAAAERWRSAGAQLFALPLGAGASVDPAAALSVLGGAGITRLFSEGGGTIAAALLEAGLVDRMAIFSAGHVFGADGTPGIAAMPPLPLGAPPYRCLRVRRVGADVLHEWERA